MKLNKMIASVAIAACATSAFADSSRVEDLTSGFGILVKNNYDQG